MRTEFSLSPYEHLIRPILDAANRMGAFDVVIEDGKKPHMIIRNEQNTSIGAVEGFDAVDSATIEQFLQEIGVDTQKKTISHNQYLGESLRLDVSRTNQAIILVFLHIQGHPGSTQGIPRTVKDFDFKGNRA